MPIYHHPHPLTHSSRSFTRNIKEFKTQPQRAKMSMLSSLFENLGIASSGYVHMDWKETPQAHIFQVDLPGLTKNEVKLEVHQGRVLHISGCREEEPEEKGEKWHCRERSCGSFSRQFRLPEDANVEEIKASMHDGVLIVTVPKDEDLKKHSQKNMVEISGDDEAHAPKGLGRFVCCKA